MSQAAFVNYFGINGDAAYVANMKGNIVSLLQAGCCVGAILTNLVAGMYIKKKKMIKHPLHDD